MLSLARVGKMPINFSDCIRFVRGWYAKFKLSLAPEIERKNNNLIVIYIHIFLKTLLNLNLYD